MTEKLYEIEEAGKWGFIDASGQVIIEPKYGTVRNVNDDVIWVNVGGSKQYMVGQSGGKWGVVDARGNVLFEPCLALWDLTDFSEGVAWVRPMKQDNTPMTWGLINKAGEYIIPPELEFDTSPGPSTFHDGVAQVHVKEKVGYYDVGGKCILPPDRFNNVSWFEGDRAWVHEGGDAEAGYWGDGVVGGSWGLIDRQGTIVMPPRFDDHLTFSEGVAWVNRGGKREEPDLLDPWPACTNGKWGLVDTDGQLVLEYAFDKVDNFYGGSAFVRQGKTWGYIDKTGTFLSTIAGEFDDLVPERGLIIAKKQGKQGFMDRSGKIVLDIIYDKINGLESIDWVKTGGKWFIFHHEDHRLIEPEIACELQFLHRDGHAHVVVDGKHGMMNPEGTLVIQPEYSYINDIRDGVAWVNEGGTYDGFSGLRGGTWGLINTAGEFIVEPIYDSVFEGVNDPLTRVDKGKVWGYVNNRGEVIWYMKE